MKVVFRLFHSCYIELLDTHVNNDFNSMLKLLGKKELLYSITKQNVHHLKITQRKLKTR